MHSHFQGRYNSIDNAHNRPPFVISILITRASNPSARSQYRAMLRAHTAGKIQVKAQEPPPTPTADEASEQFQPF
jgi:hypothetical protein